VTIDSSEPPLPEPHLPARDPRDPHSHKGTFGTIAIVGGSVSGGTMMTGAPALAALGAFRAGAGLVRLVCPGSALAGALAIVPSATGLVLPTDRCGAIVAHEAAALLDSVLGSCDALALGPGLGSDAGNQQGVETVVLRALQQDERPLVIDADAINALARVPEFARDFHASAILTPHPGEFRRLAEPLRISLDPTDPAQRPAAAEAMARKLGCILVLKGAGTVVTDGYQTWVCPHGHSCLATAGTGDVLTGVIVGLLGQAVGQAAGTLPNLFETARAGVLVHALAGECWAEQHHASAGLLAADLADLLPPCVESIRDTRQ